MNTPNNNLKLNGLASEPLDPALHEVETLLARAASADRAAAGPTLEDRLMLATAGSLSHASRVMEHAAGRRSPARGRRTALVSLAAVLALLVTSGVVWMSTSTTNDSTLAANNTPNSATPHESHLPTPISPTPSPTTSPITSEEVFLAMTNSIDVLSQLDGELPEVLTLLASETTQLEETLTAGDEWASDSSM